MKPRLKHVDVARGLGMLLVILGHVRLVSDYPNEVFEAIFSFHVPFFFFLSGAFFRPDRGAAETLVQRTRALLVPYLVTSALVMLDQVVLDGEDPVSFLLGIAYGTGATLRWIPLWFLPHLWLVSLVAAAICRLGRLDAWPRAAQVAFLLGSTALGSWLIHVQWGLAPVLDPDHRAGLPFSADLLPITVAWFLAGYLAREPLKAFSLEPKALLAALLLFVGIHVLSDATMDLNYRRYDDLLLTTLAACSGTYLTLGLSRLIATSDGASRPFAYLGSASLLLLIFHIAPEERVYFTLQARWPGHALAAGILSFVFALVLPLIVFEIVKRNRLLLALYLPSSAEKARDPAPPQGKGEGEGQ